MKAQEVKVHLDQVFREVGKVVVGQREMIKQMLIAMLADSHALVEGYPGLAKTLAVRTLSSLMGLKFSRIQNTPDLMPSDITGTYILEEKGHGHREFKFQEGPVFANIVLADEINRATPKSQSALLEAMQEKQVTVGNKTFKLDRPFFVLATQNPIEQEGSLKIDQTVFVNGCLRTGKELLESASNKIIQEDEKGTRLYEIDDAWTLSLNIDGKLVKKKCLLYTLPYNDELVKIKTKTGKKITVTKNHPFLVNDRGIITWKKAEELTNQDYLINPAKISFIQEQKIKSHEETLALMEQKPIPKEIPFDKDFAFWISFILSDGYIGGKVVAAVQKNYPEALDRFIEISKGYGFKLSISTYRGCRDARIYSKPLVEYLKIRFGVNGGRGKEIPGWFLSLPDEMNCEFLKVFISLESSIRDNRITFTQKSEKNVNIISQMLLREGIISWIRYDGKVFRLKIQGKDFIAFLKKIGWVDNKKTKNINLKRIIKSSFRVVPVDRSSILKLVKILGMNSFHTLKGRQNIVSRPWYGSYRGIKDGEVVMSVDSLKKFVEDVKREIILRKDNNFHSLLDTNPRQFGASIGCPMTEIAQGLSISHNQVWMLYSNGKATCDTQIKEYLKQKYEVNLAEAEKLLSYCEALLSEDIYYDKIKLISYEDYNGLVFGLTVPELQNYIAGFGGCGINHNTFPLPEAQSDRFLLKIKADYPTFGEEIEIVNRYTEEMESVILKPVLSKEHITYLQKLTRQVPVSNDLKKYAVDLVARTRQKKDLIQYGASPRASIGLILAAKANALIEGRNYVGKEDINYVAPAILRHRIILSFEAERNNMNEDDVIQKLLK